MGMTFDKAKTTLKIVTGGLHGEGPVLQPCGGKPRCGREECNGPKSKRPKLPPCGHHGMVVQCSCKLRDIQCKTCGKVFVGAATYTVDGKRMRDWYEVDDPHK